MIFYDLIDVLYVQVRACECVLLASRRIVLWSTLASFIFPIYVY